VDGTRTWTNWYLDQRLSAFLAVLGVYLRAMLSTVVLTIIVQHWRLEVKASSSDPR